MIEIYNKSSLDIQAGSPDYGDLSLYAKNVYTPTEGASKLSVDNGYTVYSDGEQKILLGYTGTETKLTLPTYITQIYHFAFYNCTDITEVAIGNSVTEIGWNAFGYCSCLSEIDLGSSVSQIDSLAFNYCSSLTRIEIPASVVEIESSAFHECKRLIEVCNSSSIPASSFENGFFGIYAQHIYTPTTGTSKLSKDNDCIVFTDGEEKILIYYTGKSSNFILPSYITKIYPWAFEDCLDLTSITLSDRITEIGDNAFADCRNLSSVTLGSAVKTIGSKAFSTCTSLKSIILPDSVTEIGDEAFAGCYYLSSVALGSAVKTIGKNAFSCYHLNTVYYNGTAEQWNGIDIGDGNSPLVNATIYYYSESKPTAEGNYWHYENGIPTKW